VQEKETKVIPCKKRKQKDIGIGIAILGSYSVQKKREQKDIGIYIAILGSDSVQKKKKKETKGTGKGGIGDSVQKKREQQWGLENWEM